VIAFLIPTESSLLAGAVFPMPNLNLRVLVVDDEPSVSNTLARILNLNGFEAIAVHSGEDAVALASTFRPDAAILDVFLDGGNDGIEIAHTILRELPTCNILLLSGQPETTELLAKASALGISFRVFAKPVRPELILDALASPRIKRESP